MIWSVLPYLIGAIVVLSLVFMLVLMGISAWECYQDDRGDEEIQSAWRDLHTHNGDLDFDLTEHMQTLKDPATLCGGSWKDPGSKWEVENQMLEELEYQTNFGRKMRGD